MQQNGIGQDHRHEHGELHGNDAPQVSLPEMQKRRGKPRVADRGFGHAFSDAAEQGERAERDDERRKPEPRDEERIQAAAGGPDDDRHDCSRGKRKMEILPGGAEGHGGKPHHRADGEVDAAGNENRRQRDRQQSELDVEPRDLEEVDGCEEIRRDDGEDRHFGGNRGGKNLFMRALHEATLQSGARATAAR